MRLRDLHFDRADFEFDVTLDKFELEGFKKLFQTRFKDPLTPAISLSASFSTGDVETADYHAHLQWHLAKNGVHLRISYYPTTVKATADEKEPFAEGAMLWLGTFFKADKAPAHVHLAFEYDARTWRLVIPLPIKVPLDNEPQVEIDGMSLNLEKKSLGMSQAWIVSYENRSQVLLYGNRAVQFNSFDIIEEIGELSKLAGLFIKKVENETDAQ